MDEQRRELRASDSDREAAAERLRLALNEGRLNLHEYDDRLARAFQAVTYGELEKLFADLPVPASGKGSGKGARREARTPHAEPQPALDAPGYFAALPTWLRVLWGIWLTLVLINLVVWTLVSVSEGDPEYFWPVWVAGPWGAALLAISVVVTMARRGRATTRSH